MSKLNWYVGDYNGILTDLKQQVKLATPRDADVWVTFQDCQGSYKDLITSSKQLGLGKPVYTVQHGRGSTTDYAAPNSMALNCDKYLCWGLSDYERLSALGYKDRAAIVGCPLNIHIRPKVQHREKVVLFIPVNTGKEEPENIATYYELLKLRYNKAQVKVLQHKTDLKKKWGFNDKINVSFNELSEGFDVVAKLLPWHDKSLYHGSVVKGFQDTPHNNQILFNLLRNVDLVVGMDEGTTEMFAYGHDVPVIIAEGFKYHQHPDGRTPVEIEGYRTPAATHVQLSDLSAAIEYSLSHPEHLREERKAVAERELGTSYGDATANIIKLVKEDMRVKA
jgi:hypothetical protein